MTFTWCILRLIRQKTGLNVKSGEVIFNSNRFVKNHRQYATHRSGPSTCQLSWKRTFSTEVPGNPSPENQSHIKDRGVEKGAEKRRLKEAKKEARRQARLKGIEVRFLLSCNLRPNSSCHLWWFGFWSWVVEEGGGGGGMECHIGLGLNGGVDN